MIGLQKGWKKGTYFTTKAKQNSHLSTFINNTDRNGKGSCETTVSAHKGALNIVRGKGKLVIDRA